MKCTSYKKHLSSILLAISIAFPTVISAEESNLAVSVYQVAQKVVPKLINPVYVNSSYIAQNHSAAKTSGQISPISKRAMTAGL